MEHTTRSNTVTDTFDGDQSPTSLRVVRCVAVATDTDPTELPPLGSVVDTDALDDLYPVEDRGHCYMTFEFAETDVTIRPNGDITVELDRPERTER